MEQWRKIENYDHYYISNYGRVKSVYKKNHIILVQQTNHNGYLRVILHKNGASKPHRVHRLVGICFLDNKDNKPQINHIDGNKKNNNVDNLEWVTNAENVAHAKRLGLFRRKLSDDDVVNIRKSSDSYECLAGKYNISTSYANAVKCGRERKDVIMKCEKTNQVDISLLGTKKDGEIGRMYGLSQVTIGALRKEHGILSYQENKSIMMEKKFLDFVKKNDMTKYSDLYISENLETSPPVINKLRKKHKLPKFDTKYKRPAYMPKTLTLAEIQDREFVTRSNIDLNKKYPHIRIFAFRDERQRRGIKRVYTKGLQ